MLFTRSPMEGVEPSHPVPSQIPQTNPLQPSPLLHTVDHLYVDNLAGSMAERASFRCGGVNGRLRSREVPSIEGILHVKFRHRVIVAGRAYRGDRCDSQVVRRISPVSYSHLTLPTNRE